MKYVVAALLGGLLIVLAAHHDGSPRWNTTDTLCSLLGKVPTQWGEVDCY